MRCLRIVTVLGLAACATYVPPAAPAPRRATVVAAPFDKTWDAVIDVFAQQVITIETMERASGFIVASRAGIPHDTKADSMAAFEMADCGRMSQGIGVVPAVYVPNSAKYNVVVRQAGDSSTIQVTAKFLRTLVQNVVECSSKGSFETQFEGLVKDRAEKR